MSKKVCVSEEEAVVEFAKEVKRVLGEIQKALEVKKTTRTVIKKQLEKLFFNEDKYADLNGDIFFKKNDFDNSMRDYNSNIETFVDLSVKDKKISTLFFISALEVFKIKAEKILNEIK